MQEPSITSSQPPTRLVLASGPDHPKNYLSTNQAHKPPRDPSAKHQRARKDIWGYPDKRDQGAFIAQSPTQKNHLTKTQESQRLKTKQNQGRSSTAPIKDASGPELALNGQRPEDMTPKATRRAAVTDQLTVTNVGTACANGT